MKEIKATRAMAKAVREASKKVREAEKVQIGTEEQALTGTSFATVFPQEIGQGQKAIIPSAFIPTMVELPRQDGTALMSAADEEDADTIQRERCYKIEEYKRRSSGYKNDGTREMIERPGNNGSGINNKSYLPSPRERDGGGSRCTPHHGTSRTPRHQDQGRGVSTSTKDYQRDYQPPRSSNAKDYNNSRDYNQSTGTRAGNTTTRWEWDDTTSSGNCTSSKGNIQDKTSPSAKTSARENINYDYAARGDTTNRSCKDPIKTTGGSRETRSGGGSATTSAGTSSSGSADQGTSTSRNINRSDEPPRKWNSRVVTIPLVTSSTSSSTGATCSSAKAGGNYATSSAKVVNERRIGDQQTRSGPTSTSTSCTNKVVTRELPAGHPKAGSGVVATTSYKRRSVSPDSDDKNAKNYKNEGKGTLQNIRSGTLQVGATSSSMLVVEGQDQESTPVTSSRPTKIAKHSATQSSIRRVERARAVSTEFPFISEQDRTKEQKDYRMNYLDNSKNTNGSTRTKNEHVTSRTEALSNVMKSAHALTSPNVKILDRNVQNRTEHSRSACSVLSTSAEPGMDHVSVRAFGGNKQNNNNTSVEEQAAAGDHGGQKEPKKELDASDVDELLRKNIMAPVEYARAVGKLSDVAVSRINEILLSEFAIPKS
ncbi:unnamed protein product [Amoebophrya sp. A25]|nr:unnamed protein product [Amoebophrya sp. A25]|eukprot:GSA25T00003601001.1